MTAKTTTQPDAVAAAEQLLAAAQEAAAKETQRVKRASEELQDLTEQIANTDPDDAAAFAKLVTERETLAARREAMVTRQARAMAAEGRARGAVMQAGLAAQEEQLADLAAKIRAEDERIMAEAQAAEEGLVTRVRGLRALLNEWRELEMRRRAAAGRDGPGIQTIWLGSELAKTGDSDLVTPALLQIRSARAHMAIYASR